MGLMEPWPNTISYEPYTLFQVSTLPSAGAPDVVGDQFNLHITTTYYPSAVVPRPTNKNSNHTACNKIVPIKDIPPQK